MEGYICVRVCVCVCVCVCVSHLGFPWGSAGKESACNVGDLGLILGLRRYPGEGKGYPLQYSCLENSKYRGAYWATVHGFAKNWTRLSAFHFHFGFSLLVFC